MKRYIRANTENLFIYDGHKEVPKDVIKVIVADGVTSIADYAFYGCKSLKEITIPEGVTSIGFNAFLGCNSLENISLPSTISTIRNYGFDYCENLTDLTIPEGVERIDKCAFDCCVYLRRVIIPPTVTSIGDYAFRGCANLTYIVLPDSVTVIGKHVFKDCPKVHPNILLKANMLSGESDSMKSLDSYVEDTHDWSNLSEAELFEELVWDNLYDITLGDPSECRICELTDNGVSIGLLDYHRNEVRVEYFIPWSILSIEDIEALKRGENVNEIAAKFKDVIYEKYGAEVSDPLDSSDDAKAEAYIRDRVIDHYAAEVFIIPDNKLAKAVKIAVDACKESEWWEYIPDYLAGYIDEDKYEDAYDAFYQSGYPDTAIFDALSKVFQTYYDEE